MFFFTLKFSPRLPLQASGLVSWGEVDGDSWGPADLTQSLDMLTQVFQEIMGHLAMQVGVVKVYSLLF